SDFITVFNNTILDMTAGNGGASSEGSGIGGLGGIATGICISNSTTSNLTSNSISGLTGGVGGDNDFSGLGGGGNGGPSIGICLSGSTDSIIFSNNISSMDGGAGKSGSYNDVSSGDGGPSTGIYLSNSTGNSIFFNNMSFLNGGAGGYNSCGAEYGGDGGASTGISLSSDSIGNNVSLNKIFSLTGGSGCSYGHEGGFKNKGGTGGTSWGVSLSNSINNTLSSNDIYLLRGGTGGAGGYEGSSGAGGMVAGSYIEDSINNTLLSNNIYSLTGGTGGPMTYKGYPGKGGMTTGSYIKDSINNTLFSNDIESIIGGSDYWGGVSSYFMYLYQANSTTIKDNAIKITDYGFYLYSTLDCLIYNNLVNVSASNPASFAGTIYRNFWNTTQQIGLRIYFSGHQIGGNYWTNPTGTGYSDTCMDSGEDGFCSNNYTLAANNTDYLPLSDGFNYNFLPPSPGDNSVLNQDWAYINVTTKDDESSDWIALEWNSTTNYTMDMGSFETNYYYNKTALVDGAYSYRVFANDSTGRMYVSKIRYLIIDIVTPPIISNLTYSESVFLGDGSTVIKIDVFDHSNVSSVWIEEDSTGMPENNSMSFESGTNDSGTYNYTLTYSSVGNISFKIYANDSLGNMQNTSSYMIYVSDLSVSLNMDKFIYNLGEDITIFGNAISQSVNVTDNPISIWLDEKKLKLRYDGFLTESWGLSGWEYYRPVIIENTAGSLTDYLVLIQGNMSQTFSDGKVQQDCSDIRFTTNNLSEYTYAVSECNLAEDGVVNSWVNITLPNGNTTVYMFYGNPSANDTGTLWDNLWDNVSHLGIYGGLFSYNCSGYGDCFEDYDNPENYTDFYSKMNSNPEYSIDMQHKLGVSAGPFSHTCILKSNGSVECYGSSYSGFSGYNGGDAIGVTAGVWHMCILKSNGTVECFGQNNDGCAESYDGGDAVMVSAQEDNTCVLKSNGNVTCYGDNTYGQSNNYTGGDAIGVFAGGSLLTGKAHTCVLKSNGNVTCYGDNTYGQSYNYTGGDAIGISLSSMHTCILKLDGNVDCYG
ncbi:MAG: DUF2341 domain-containing protein, partial [Candidatus Aenigmarchaeota archaeon]|nr:DUF2341 domain-containing protein [Candidatus Aenigmarchaeota archaeon]